MIKVPWQLEEAVALFDLYFKSGSKLSVPAEKINELSLIYRRRAEQLGMIVDDKFRNVSGLRMQLGCIHYVVTDGAKGMSGASKLFYETYELYKVQPEIFNMILNEFNFRYKNK